MKTFTKCTYAYRKVIPSVLLFFLLSVAFAAQAQTVRYVRAGAGGGGSSWNNASGDLRAMINASSAGDQIWVAAGTYSPPPVAGNLGGFAEQLKGSAFVLKADVRIYGGFAGTETALAQRNLAIAANRSVLSGDFKKNDVITGSGATLRITNNGENARHVVVSVGNVGSAVLDGFTITGGNADGADDAGTLINGQMIYWALGGGMYNSSSSPAVTNVIFTGNSAIQTGGALYNEGSAPAVTNAVFDRNYAVVAGGGMLNGFGSSPVIVNSTFAGNYANLGGGIHAVFSSYPVIHNSIIWGNSSGAGAGAQASFTYTNSMVQGVTLADASGNISGNTDPQFKSLDPASADYLRLHPCSPVANKGNNSRIPSAINKDVAGNSRIYGKAVDLGAYEFQGAALGVGAEGVIYVKVGATGAGNSWDCAIGNLQTAIDAAAAGAQIWVASGTYKPTRKAGALVATPDNRENTFLLKADVKIYAGFTGNETELNQRNWKTNVTTLSGDLGITGDVRDNAYHVVVSAGAVGAAVLDGFTISGGNADGPGFKYIKGKKTTQNQGGGIIVLSSSPSIANCTFSGNRANGHGGGMCNVSAAPSVSSCTFSSNETNNAGGGMYNENASPLITGSTFTRNKGNISGGAIANISSSPSARNCVFQENTAGSFGGAIYSIQDVSFPITSSIFSGNKAQQGGGIYNSVSSPSITNCTFFNNTSFGGGGGMYNQVSSNPVIKNTIIYGNTSGITNYVISGNPSTPVISNSLVQGLTDTSNGNISGGTDPQFVSTDPLSADYLRLKAASAAINAGSNAALVSLDANTTDLAGKSRVFDYTNGGVIDLGAYEFQAKPINVGANNIIYVKKGGRGIRGNSWSEALPELAEALKWAKEREASWTEANPLQIWVAAGTYKPMFSPASNDFGTNAGRANAFLLVKNVKIYGGFAGNETSLPQRDLRSVTNKSILSGDFNGNDVINGSGESLIISNNAENAYNVVMSVGSAGAAALNGFTITGGNANYTGRMSINGSLVIRNNGGGILNMYGSSPEISQISLTGNNASDSGGGMANMSESVPSVTNAVFLKNIAVKGGGVYNDNSSPAFTNVVFMGNRATAVGAGITNNEASPTVVNATIFGNYAPARGGGGGYNVGNAFPKFRNSIIWGNNTPIFSAGISSPDFTYSLVQQLTLTTNGNISGSADPLFASTDPASPDFLRLKPNSPVINAGNNSAVQSGIVTDLGGQSRIQNNTVDMGAYEYQGKIILPDANGVVYVKKGGAGSGSSWNTAIAELADALQSAKYNTGIRQIWVAAGTYKPMYSPADNNFGVAAGRDNTFLLVNNVKIYGGFAGIETSLSQRDITNTANKTTLSGDINNDDYRNEKLGDFLTIYNVADNSYHVVTGAGNLGSAVLDGFTISGGAALGSGSVTINNYQTDRDKGGAVYNVGSASAVFKNCSFKWNMAGIGGAIHNNGSSPTIENSEITSNWATDGGGVYNIQSNPAFRFTMFRGNQVSRNGGAVYNEKSSSGFINVLIAGNKAPQGGGIYNVQCSPIIDNTTIAGNAGDAIYSTSLNSAPLIRNSIIYGNTAGMTGGNGGAFYSLVQGPASTAVGNINNTDPMFVNAPLYTAAPFTGGDYRLTAGSPVINAANNDFTYPNFANDLDGNSRIYDGRADMGAYEYKGSKKPGANRVASEGAGGNSGNFAVNLPEVIEAIVYPVPTRDVVWLRGGMPGSDARLIDKQGRIVRSIRIKSEEESINLSQLPVGIYFLQQAGGKTLKVVKE